MGFKDRYRFTKNMLEAQLNIREPFKWEKKAKRFFKIIFTPLSIALGAVVVTIEWIIK